MKTSSGFTLVELIVTMVIIAVIAAISGPLFFDAQVFQRRGFYDEAVSAVRYAQKHAVATGCSVQVQITATTIRLLRAANVAGCTAGPFDTEVADPSGSTATFTRTAPNGVAITSTAGSFTFFPLGNASTNVTITVGSGGPQFQVVGETGLVRRL